MPFATESSRRRLTHASAVLIGTLLVSAVALWNRFPLVYPDSLTYLDSGQRVARALFQHQTRQYYGMRSFTYSLGILLVHWNRHPWPIVFLQAFLTAWVLWLVVRSLLPHNTVKLYLALTAALTLLTSIGWYAGMIMPDFLGPLLYLCTYLWVFARPTLSRPERIGVLALIWWAFAGHTTHLMIGGVLCVLLASLAFFHHEGRARHLRAVGTVLLLAVLAVGTHEALHAYLYGKPSLNGARGPFLMARLIDDGTGTRYLREHCAEHRDWALCDRVQDLPQDPDTFIWGQKGVWGTSSPEVQRQLLDQEMPLALATIRAYPLQQARKSLANAWLQLTHFGYDDLDPSDYVKDDFREVFPASRNAYINGRQANDKLYRDFFSGVQYCTTYLSLATIALLLIRYLRRLSLRALSLSFVVLTVVLVNACVTGTLSMVDDRYQSRVIWLIPMLAGLLAFETLQWRHRKSNSRSN